MKQPPLDLWFRMAAPKKYCTVVLESFCTNSGHGDVEHWRVTIRRRDQPDTPPIVTEARTGIEALTLRLDRSLAQRWHQEPI